MSHLDPTAVPFAEPADRHSAFARVAWRWPDAVLGLAPLLVLLPLSALARQEELPRAGPTVLGLFALAWMVGYPLWVGYRRHVRLLHLPSPRTIGTELVVALPTLLVLWFGLGLVVLAWQKLVGAGTPPPERFDYLPQAPNGAAKAATVLLIVLLGPVAEEVFFRGLLYNTLRRYLPPAAAALAQAALFGLGHPFGTTYVLAAGLLGLAFAAVYEWRKTLFTPMVLHVAQNSVALLVTFALAPTADSPALGVRGEPDAGGVRVTFVQEDSAAAEAGIQVGDVIVSIDSKPARSQRDVAWVVRTKKAGDAVQLQVRRDGQALELRAVLKRRGEPAPNE